MTELEIYRCFHCLNKIIDNTVLNEFKIGFMKDKDDAHVLLYMLYMLPQQNQVMENSGIV